MIPRTLHQIWIGGKPLPEKFAAWSETFRTKNPGWAHRLWDDAQVEALIAERFPQHLASYRKIEKLAQKSDFARYIILAIHGGLYADTDCECRRPIDFVADGDDLIVAYELKTNSPKVRELYRTTRSEIFCQWTFLASAGNRFLLELVEEVARRLGQRMSDDVIANIVQQSGPGAFTDVLKKHLAAGGHARIVPSSWFGAASGRSVPHFSLSFMFPELFRQVYVRHHPTLSWVDPKMKREWMIRNFFFLGPPKPKKS